MNEEKLAQEPTHLDIEAALALYFDSIDELIVTLDEARRIGLQMLNEKRGIASETNSPTNE